MSPFLARRDGRRQRGGPTQPGPFPARSVGLPLPLGAVPPLPRAPGLGLEDVEHMPGALVVVRLALLRRREGAEKSPDVSDYSVLLLLSLETHKDQP